MKYLLPLLLIIYIPTFSQKINPPTWTGDAFFTCAKIKVYQPGSQKVVFDDYKESTLDIKVIGGVAYTATINIPDRFYLKEGEIDDMTYQRKDGSISLTYMATSGFKMAHITIFYRESFISDTPESIIIVGTDDYTKKPLKQVTVIMYEVKE